MSWWEDADEMIGRPASADVDPTEEFPIIEKKVIPSRCPTCKRPFPDNGKGYCKICSRKL